MAGQRKRMLDPTEVPLPPIGEHLFDFWQGQAQVCVQTGQEVDISIATGENEFTIIRVQVMWQESVDGTVEIAEEPTITITKQYGGG